MLTECTPPAGEAPVCTPKNPGEPRTLRPSLLLGYRLQGWGLALPDDRVAFGPKDLPGVSGAAAPDLKRQSLPGLEKLQGNAKAQLSLETWLKGKRGVSPTKRADAVVEGGLTLLALAIDPNGYSYKNKAAVGRELA